MASLDGYYYSIDPPITEILLKLPVSQMEIVQCNHVNLVAPHRSYIKKNLTILMYSGNNVTKLVLNDQLEPLNESTS